DLPGKRATLFHLEDGAIRGVIAINTPRELKLSRKWMNQGRTIDLATLTDASTALA
ncbi:MAG: pyridine nucleotide-disulfide oxidoreductase, partial [Burkholderia sp.]|nr:pyridine nucleotide-disulfide oxidoreductase [Burkholderia sp.]